MRDNLQKDLDKEKTEIQEIQRKLAYEVEQRKNESFRRSFLETETVGNAHGEREKGEEIGRSAGKTARRRLR